MSLLLVTDKLKSGEWKQNLSGEIGSDEPMFLHHLSSWCSGFTEAVTCGPGLSLHDVQLMPGSLSTPQ